MIKTILLSTILLSSMSAEARGAELTESRRSLGAAVKYEGALSKASRKKRVSLGNPVFLRITKTQSLTDKQGKLEAFIEDDNGTFIAFKRWDICTYSGKLGPKLKHGDRQSPEGFYFVKPNQTKPNESLFQLSSQF